MMADSIDRLRAALADRYTIEREIGRGGMATVYLAEDLKHGRRVALKVLLPELAATLGGERFIQEIRVTANLQHPHILALYDSGEADGLLFYVMPYVEGESLRDRLKRETQLPVQDALQIAQQVASALDFAHRHDVIHRDIKPENVLLHEGVAMVADFGIALAVKAAGGERLTETGLSIGTPEYMSPEQVAGERNLDARSDIYSLACVLYEMLAGQPPFTAATAQAVLARHVTDPVPAITTVRPGVARPVAVAIAKALSKAPADRFPSGNGFAEALRAEEVETESKSIVVLPFGNMSADPANEYFCDGLTEAIINTFTAIKDFKVVARTSAFSFKGKDIDVRDIGRQLDVNHVLEGSVQKAGQRLRITAQLIDVSNGYHIWSERFDRTMDDVFAIQDEISLAIADNLQLQLHEADKDKLVKRYTDDAEAYSLYLKGRYFYRKFTKEGFEKAVANFELAAKKDPSFALPFAGLADTYIEYGYFGMLPQREAMEKAKQMALKAIGMDPSVGEAHTTLGVLYGLCEYDLESAAREHQMALTLSPSSADAHHHFAHFLAIHGRFDEAIREMEGAIELEPLSVNLNWCFATTLYQARRADEAIQKFQESIEIDPSYPLHYYYLGRTYLQKGMHDEAIAALEKGITFPSVYVMASSVLGHAYALAGDTARARAILDELLTLSESEPVDPVLIAQIHIGLGEADAAIDYLEQGYQAHSFHLAGIGFESCFDGVRGHTRFSKLLSKMRFPHVMDLSSP